MKPRFKLILISSESGHMDEVKILNHLFNLGLELFHLRKPLWSVEQMREYLRSVPPAFHNKIIIHSHFALAGEFKIKGIHLNEDNKKLISQFESYNIISASFHSLKDIDQNSYPYQYIFLSPVFDSISKPGYSAGFDLKKLAEDLEVLKRKNQILPEVIALGGISVGNIDQVKRTGFSGAAVSGAVWQSENPEKAFSEIQSVVLSN